MGLCSMDMRHCFWLNRFLRKIYKYFTKIKHRKSGNCRISHMCLHFDWGLLVFRFDLSLMYSDAICCHLLFLTQLQTRASCLRKMQQCSLNQRRVSMVSNPEILLCPMAFVLMHWCTIDGSRMANSDKLKCQQWQRWASPLLTVSLRWGDRPSAEWFLIKCWHLTHTHAYCTQTRTSVTRGVASLKGSESGWRTSCGINGELVA